MCAKNILGYWPILHLSVNGTSCFIFDKTSFLDSGVVQRWGGVFKFQLVTFTSHCFTYDFFVAPLDLIVDRFFYVFFQKQSRKPLVLYQFKSFDHNNVPFYKAVILSEREIKDRREFVHC